MGSDNKPILLEASHEGVRISQFIPEIMGNAKELGMADSQAKQVRDYVQALEQDDRYIVLLYYADGLTPMEISRVLDLPSTRVRARLEELRSQLAGLTRNTPRTKTQAPPHVPKVTAYA